MTNRDALRAFVDELLDSVGSGAIAEADLTILREALFTVEGSSSELGLRPRNPFLEAFYLLALAASPRQRYEIALLAIPDAAQMVALVDVLWSSQAHRERAHERIRRDLAEARS